MDMDDLCITNTNRQIHALASTIGQSKTETMATRIREINPEAEVIPISSFYTASNAENCCRRNRTSSLTPSTP